MIIIACEQFFNTNSGVTNQVIYNLDGMVETPEYRKNTHVCIYDNVDYENYPPHWHSAVEILMPVDNSYTAIVEGETYVVKPYELLFIGSEVVHSTIAPREGRRYFFQIDIAGIRNIAGINAILPFVGQVRHFTPSSTPEIHRKLVKLYEEICNEYFDSEDLNGDMKISDDFSISTLCEPIIYAKFLTMLAIIGKYQLENALSNSLTQVKRKEYASKIMSICSYIDEHFTEEITLEEVASVAGYSKFHFSRIFKQLTNISFYKYVNLQRIKYAEELLLNPDLSISKIAIACGYSSTSAFIRMFKQLKNCTPTDYKELHKNYHFKTDIRVNVDNESN